MKKSSPTYRAEQTIAALTPDEYRREIRRLLVGPLGIAWATPNILAPYGGLKRIPKAALPAVYAKAQADAEALFSLVEVVPDIDGRADMIEVMTMSEAALAGLPGMVVSWTASENDEGRFRVAGRGRIMAMITASSRPLLMVKVIPRAGDSEPPHGILVTCDDAGLKLFPSLDAEDRWFAWMMKDPEHVVSLVPRTNWV